MGSDKANIAAVQSECAWLAGWGTSLFFQAQAGLLAPWGSSWQAKPTCISDRFFLGGVNTLRGFHDKQAGPSEGRLGPIQVKGLTPTSCLEAQLEVL